MGLITHSLSYSKESLTEFILKPLFIANDIRDIITVRTDIQGSEKLDFISALSKITKKEVIDLFEKHLVNNTKRLDVEILANNHEDENDKLEKENNDTSSKDNIKRIRVISLSDFKKRTSMYPDLTYNPRF